MGITQKTGFICFCILLLLSPGCFNSQDKLLDSKQLESRIDDLNNLQIKYEEEISKKIINLTFEVESLTKTISKNKSEINKLKDSLMLFQQLDITLDTSEDDIINSLIRIQSKLNVIEEKLFISDSLYFNMLNELIRIDEKILLMDKIDIIDDVDTVNNKDINIQSAPEVSDPTINKGFDFDKKYKEGYNFFLLKEYDNAINIFREIISLDPSYVNSDNSQFWIGQIYFQQEEYAFAILEYEKVFSLGDKNKMPDAEYKIAISYKILGNKDKAIKKFNEIIVKYPNNKNLLLKAKKELKTIN